MNSVKQTRVGSGYKKFSPDDRMRYAMELRDKISDMALRYKTNLAAAWRRWNND